MSTEPAWAMMKFPADLAATLVEIDVRVAQVKARPRASAWPWAADGTGTSLAAVSEVDARLRSWTLHFVQIVR